MAIINDEEKKKLNGVDDELLNRMDTTYVVSDDVKQADAERNEAKDYLSGLVSQKDIVSQSVKNEINKEFKTPKSVTEADTWLATQLQKIQSGKTSYSDQLRDMMDKIMNREKFSYDVDTDPLFQQALASSMNSGKQAMQDTIGQASALTGGYGSTYATTAGNQAYNSFIEDAYDNLPQYYQRAMQAYQMEGDQMYQQYGMLSTEDAKEYERMLGAYDATYQHRNQMYNEAYGQFRDEKSDAFAMANLQLNEHGQRVSDATNYYNTVADISNTKYNREYTAWADSVNQATQQAQLYNSDWWNQTNFDEGVRQYEQSFAEQQRQYNESLAEQKRQHNEQMSYNWASLNKSKSGNGGSGGGSGGYKEPSQTQKANALKAYNEGGEKAYEQYLDSLPSDVDIESIDAYVFGYTDESGEKVQGYGVLPYSDRTYTVIDDGGTNWWWGVDNNAKVSDQYGNEYTLEQLSEYDEEIAKELSNKKYTKGSTYTKKK